LVFFEDILSKSLSIIFLLYMPRKNNNVPAEEKFRSLFNKRCLSYAKHGINTSHFEFDITNNVIYCIKCKSYIHDKRPRAISLHVLTEKHKSHIKDDAKEEVDSATEPPEPVILSQRDKIMNNIRVVYYICKKGTPLNHFQPLLDLINDCNGKISKEHYHTSSACNDFLDCLNLVQQNEDRNKLKNAEFYSLSLDGNTIRAQTRVSIFARYFDSEKQSIEQTYQGLMDVQVRNYNANAELQEVLQTESGLNMFRIMSSHINEIKGWSKFADGCSDHAPNVYGERTGLRGRIHAENPRSLWIGVNFLFLM